MTHFELVINCSDKPSMFKLIMTKKGFTETQTNVETPDDIGMTERPLEINEPKPKRVDINVLKSKLKRSESKQLKKNLSFLALLILGLGILGIYLSI